MDWKPFVVCGAQEEPPRVRGLNGPEGVGDRLRTAAFAERQAAAAFSWAAETLAEAPSPLRAAWRELAAEESKHLGWLLKRMEELGVAPDGRPVSDRLWRALTACRGPLEFARLMAEAEQKGKTAEESFQKSLAGRDPRTADIFGRIAEEEERHIHLQRSYEGGTL